MARFKLTQAANRERAGTVFERLHKEYPDAQCSLDYETPLELLVATILAAQCTDVRVNEVTKTLFRRFRKATDYIASSDAELEEAIRSCGFYRNKAKSIRRACAAVDERFGGRVPGTMDELLELDGVGRKTANVLLSECFGVEGIVVDTHCGRLARRLGFTKNNDPVKVEKDLMKIVPRERWALFSHCLVFHGRAVCHARGPKCSTCVVNELCPFPSSAQGRKIAK